MTLYLMIFVKSNRKRIVQINIFATQKFFYSSKSLSVAPGFQYSSVLPFFSRFRFSPLFYVDAALFFLSCVEPLRNCVLLVLYKIFKFIPFAVELLSPPPSRVFLCRCGTDQLTQSRHICPSVPSHLQHGRAQPFLLDLLLSL